MSNAVLTEGPWLLALGLRHAKKPLTGLRRRPGKLSRPWPCLWEGTAGKSSEAGRNLVACHWAAG